MVMKDGLWNEDKQIKFPLICFMQYTKCLQYVKVAKFSLPPFELEIINLILELNKLKLRKVNCFAQSNKANKEEQKCKPEFL